MMRDLFVAPSKIAPGWLVSLLASLSLVLAGGNTAMHTHDSSFTPDAILRVMRANTTTLAGINRYTTMVNGSVPGPPLRFKEDQVQWVRVYNDMVDANLTMVSREGSVFDPVADLIPFGTSSTGTESLKLPIHSRMVPPWPLNGPFRRNIFSTTSSPFRRGAPEPTSTTPMWISRRRQLPAP